MKIHIVVPTFRESELAEQFLASWEAISEPEIEIVVVNGNPGDETSALLQSWSGKWPVLEVEGSPALFWTGLVCLGLETIAASIAEDDLFLIMNIDVLIEGDPIGSILSRLGSCENRQVTIPVSGSDGRILSAGVLVRSWLFSLNRHIFDGMNVGDLPGDEVIEATYLPTRFLLCPAAVLMEGHFPDVERLPHYCADYEYTNRLRKHGYVPVIYTGATASVSETNTGLDTFLQTTSLGARIKGLTDIKCPYNARFRFRFVRLVYPPATQAMGVMTHFAKILLEVIFGGKQLDHLRNR